MEPLRIYVGGLTPDIKEDDVLGRFRPFGAVHGCEIVRGKGLTTDPSHCRGFAYVEFTPKDQAALSRVFSLYNGCKWRGQKLRVEHAKPTYVTKLQKEWEEEQQQAVQTSLAGAEQHNQLAMPAANADGGEGAEHTNTIRITMPGKRKSVVVDLAAKATSYRAWFPAHKQQRTADLSWDPLPQSKRVALQAHAETAARPAAAAAKAAAAAAAAATAHTRANDQQQQRPESPPTRGVAVPYQYKEQQQQQQQPAKGMKAQVDAEHWSQLKLLKRIAEQEKAAALQQQQAEQMQQRASTTPTANTQGGKHMATQAKQQQQQQHVPAGVFVMSDDDDEGVTAAVGAGAADALAQQLSRFDDSESEDMEPAAAAAAAARHKGLLTSGRQQKTGHVAAGETARDKQQATDAKQQQQQQQQQQEDDNSFSDDQVAAAAPAAVEDHSQGHLSDGVLRHVAAAPPIDQQLSGHGIDSRGQDEGSSSSGSIEGEVEYSESSGLDNEACPVGPGAAAAAPDMLPKADCHHNQPPQQQQQEQVVRPLWQPVPTAVSSLPVLSFMDPSEAAQLETAATAAALDRFGSDSEEVLVDVEDEGTTAPAATRSKPQSKQPGSASWRKQQQQQQGCRRDGLLCPLATRAGTGRAAVVGIAAQQRQQQQGVVQPRSSMKRQQQMQQRQATGSRGQKRHHAN